MKFLLNPFLFLCLLGAGAIAASVGLAWDPSPDSSVVGYTIWYGTNSSRTYTLAHPTGNVTNTTVEGLVPGFLYYFTATAHDGEGNTSEECNEVTYTPPLDPSVPKPPPPRFLKVDAQ